MSNVPDTLRVIDGEYDEWVLLKKIFDDAKIADTVQTISCDTRDFALGWNFKQPEPYKKAECGLERRSNDGLARMRRLKDSPAIGDYLIEPSEIVHGSRNSARNPEGSMRTGACCQRPLTAATTGISNISASSGMRVAVLWCATHTGCRSSGGRFTTT